MHGTLVEQRYDRAQRAFHWIMAAIILVAIALGVVAALLPQRAPPRVELLWLHKSLGMTALVLWAPRALYRLIAGAPAYPRDLTRAMRAAARTEHVALYALMIALPVSGYVNSVAGGHDAPWFGLFSWPEIAPHDKALSHAAGGAHFWFAWAIGALLTLHVAAAMWHRWVLRDAIFARMWRARAGRGA